MGDLAGAASLGVCGVADEWTKACDLTRWGVPACLQDLRWTLREYPRKLALCCRELSVGINPKQRRRLMSKTYQLLDGHVREISPDELDKPEGAHIACEWLAPLVRTCETGGY